VQDADTLHSGLFEDEGRRSRWGRFGGERRVREPSIFVRKRRGGFGERGEYPTAGPGSDGRRGERGDERL